MAFKLSNAEHKKLDTLLGKLLDGYKDGDYTKSETIGALAHVIAAGVIDNESEFKNWLKSKTLKNWQDLARATRPKRKK